MPRETELKNGCLLTIYMERELKDLCQSKKMNISLICRRALADALKLPEEKKKELLKMVKKDKYELIDDIIKTAIYPGKRYAELLLESIKKTSMPRKKIVEYFQTLNGNGVINIKEGIIVYKKE